MRYRHEDAVPDREARVRVPMLVDGMETSIPRCDDRDLLLEAVREMADRCDRALKRYDSFG